LKKSRPQFSFFYKFLRPVVSLGVKIFYKKYVIKGFENIPLDKPIILVANHQNAMIDPVVCCVSSPRQLHWLTRADVFKNPLVAKILRQINMLPVYRERDKAGNVADVNTPTFDECKRRLKMKEVICIFPEGSHRGMKQLCPLKKGVARLAIDSLKSGVEDLYIVPVGLDYSNYYSYRANLLITYGKAIKVTVGEQEDARQMQLLMTEIRSGMKEVMVDIEDKENYEEIISSEPLCRKISGSNSLVDQMFFFKKVVKKMASDNELKQNYIRIANPYASLRGQLEIREDLYWDSLGINRILFLSLFALPAVFSILFFGPLFLFAEWVVKNKVKDMLFNNSIRLVIWTFIGPLWIFFSVFLAGLISSWLMGAIMFGLIGILGGIIALYWVPMWKGCMQFLRLRSLRGSAMQHFAEWKQYRKELIELISKIK
jgi:1-acyl-sn-glycerol-3-phosphate acyltransferase